MTGKEIVRIVRYIKNDDHNNSICTSHEASSTRARFEFIPSDNPGAFGFLNPDEVIRAAHLIPAFYHGGTEMLLKGLSVARDEGKVDDWRYFYVNM